MRIEFIGTRPKQRFYNLGIQNNNKVDRLELVLDIVQNGIDLSKFKAFLKVQNKDLSFCKKDDKLDSLVENGKLTLFYELGRAVTQHCSVDMQLQFEAEHQKDIIVCQMQMFQLSFENSIPADEWLEEKEAGVIHDHELRIREIESKETIVAATHYEFPTVGKRGVLYIAEKENKSYRWDHEDDRYYVVGTNYEEIKVVYGGKA